jgi:hypothetical protein
MELCTPCGALIVAAAGLAHRTLGQIDAIGVDEIQYSKAHKYLTLVYQIDLGATRLLWAGKERTIESFQGFFNTIGDEITSKIVFICSDMWEPYWKQPVRSRVPNHRYKLLERACNVLATVPTPTPSRVAIARMVSPWARRAATLSRLKIRRGLWGALSFPLREWTDFPTFPAA